MSDDLIKREDAIKALRLEYPMMPMFKELREEWAIKTEGYRKAEGVIMRLPSADRPQGEWKPLDRTWGRETWYCTNCEDAVVDMPTYMGIALYKYCPNCGAKMKGATDGNK